MPRCSFCKKYKHPRGLTLVLNDGNLLYFCSSKCQRNHGLKRDPKKTNWVKREKKGKVTEEEGTKPISKPKETPKVEEKVEEKSEEKVAEKKDSSKESK